MNIHRIKVGLETEHFSGLMKNNEVVNSFAITTEDGILAFCYIFLFFGSKEVLKTKTLFTSLFATLVHFILLQ